MSSYRSDPVPLEATGRGSGDIGAIVLAAGSGERFGGRKQFAELSAGVRLVDRAISAVEASAGTVVVVVPAGHEWAGRSTVTVVPGGADRLASVRAGLDALGGPSIVVVHDAAHPLATRTTVREVVEAVRRGADAALPFWEVPDVVKRRSDDRLETVGRDGLGLAQVPMAFRVDRLREAHGRAEESGLAVEDSALIEQAGGIVASVPGDVTNVHVVDGASLELARHLAPFVPL